MDTTGRVIRRLQKFNYERAKILIQQRRCIEQYNLKYNQDTNTYEFPFDTIEEDKYTFNESIYLGKQKECIIKNTNELLDPNKTKVLLNNIAVKKEYKASVGKEIIEHLNKFLNIGKKVISH